MFYSFKDATDALRILEWTPQQVAQWLQSVQLASYAAIFMAQNIGGTQLLHLDSNQIKVH